MAINPVWDSPSWITGITFSSPMHWIVWDRIKAQVENLVTNEGNEIPEEEALKDDIEDLKYTARDVSSEIQSSVADLMRLKQDFEKLTPDQIRATIKQIANDLEESSCNLEP